MHLIHIVNLFFRKERKKVYDFLCQNNKLQVRIIVKVHVLLTTITCSQDYVFKPKCICFIKFTISSTSEETRRDKLKVSTSSSESNYTYCYLIS